MSIKNIGKVPLGSQRDWAKSNWGRAARYGERGCIKSSLFNLKPIIWGRAFRWTRMGRVALTSQSFWQWWESRWGLSSGFWPIAFLPCSLKVAGERRECRGGDQGGLSGLWRGRERVYWQVGFTDHQAHRLSIRIWKFSLMLKRDRGQICPICFDC